MTHAHTPVTAWYFAAAFVIALVWAMVSITLKEPENKRRRLAEGGQACAAANGVMITTEFEGTVCIVNGAKVRVD